MTISRLLPLALCATLAACNPATPDAPEAAATPAAADAETDSDTVAVYGDEAPVAIAAEAPVDDHAHNADGSHVDGSDADHGADDAAVDDDHAHPPGQADHDH